MLCSSPNCNYWWLPLGSRRTSRTMDTSVSIFARGRQSIMIFSEPAGCRN